MNIYWTPFIFLFIAIYPFEILHALPSNKISLGIDVLLSGKYDHILKGKRIGIIANHTSVNGNLESTIHLLMNYSQKGNFSLNALFAPEHGITGAAHSEKQIEDGLAREGIPIFSLHGITKRPTKEMLDKVDLLIFDIQDIGSRSYTYISTLFYVMEEAAKHNKEVMVLDRPNPINGLTVDGPLMEEKWRSFVGYINVPYCHGMTVGELASYFNEEYKIECTLHIIPMQGWKRTMTFQDTGLFWIPTSPYIPEASTALYYPITGILGELQLVNIGIGYTLPFKIVGAPWIDATLLAKSLNAQNLPGVKFHPFYYQPFYGRFAKEECKGVLIGIEDPLKFKPVTTQYVILGILKSLFPYQFREALEKCSHRKDMFCKVNGTEEVYRLMNEEPYIVWKLRSLDEKKRNLFLVRRKKYLLPNYAD